MKIESKYIIRNIESDDLLDTFLISSIVTFLGLRLLLSLLGWPTIGNNTLHIAHMLYGGLALAAALVISLFLLNKEANYIAAIIGGFGFGLFIDELGKFITQDNNYFYQPAVPLIYLTFMGLYLAFRILKQKLQPTPTEYTVNALEYIKEAIVHDLDREEKRQALKMLQQADPSDPLTTAIYSLLQDVEAIPTKSGSIIISLRKSLRQQYRQIVAHRWFTTGLMTLFVLSSIATIIISAFQFNQQLSLAQLLQFGSSLVSGLCVLVGVYYLRVGNRHQALTWYKWSLLISIFFTQFFQFYYEQVSAVLGLFWDIIILGLVNYLQIQDHVANNSGKDSD